MTRLLGIELTPGWVSRLEQAGFELELADEAAAHSAGRERLDGLAGVALGQVENALALAGHFAALEPALAVVRLGEEPLLIAGQVLAVDELYARLRKAPLCEGDLSRFVSALSHDLKEPLRMIRGYLELLQRRSGHRLDEDGREFLQTALDGAARAQQMVQGLRSLVRAGSATATEPVELAHCLQEALGNLTLLLAERRAEVTQDPLPCARGVAGELTQLFQNLLENAAKYSQAPARIHVGVRRRPFGWEVRVEDHGTGIPPTDQERIFQPFERLHGREVEGSGLGLAICRRIVHSHGGKIWVESQPGDGSTFCFTLPKRGSELSRRRSSHGSGTEAVDPGGLGPHD